METVDYTIGDDIVCIESHPQKIVNEGEVFKVLALKNFSCKCGIGVDVGIKDFSEKSSYNFCGNCNTSYPRAVNSGIWWLNANRFKKLDTLVNISELTEILEKPAFS